MNTDFYDAFLRHLEDAEYLFRENRIANADQLYGYSAECGLKALMKAFGMSVDSRSVPSPKDKKHLPEIWARYAIYQSGAKALAYTLPTSNPFADWDINNRYAHRSDFNKADVQVHQQATNKIKTLINQAFLEGRITV
ncbi:MAG: hypothetical protein LBN06_02290 [Prevotellaceae bacterium]|jgi:hypothetical protein|nr:hypothetical protein [Prevotellaceae bacterium]